jgi:hypothetical protein
VFADEAYAEKVRVGADRSLFLGGRLGQISGRRV